MRFDARGQKEMSQIEVEHSQCAYRSWLEPVFLLQLRDRAKVIIGRQKDEAVLQSYSGDERINGFELPTLTTQRDL